MHLHFYRDPKGAVGAGGIAHEDRHEDHLPAVGHLLSHPQKRFPITCLIPSQVSFSTRVRSINPHYAQPIDEQITHSPMLNTWSVLQENNQGDFPFSWLSKGEGSE